MPKNKIFFYISLTLFCISLLFFGIYKFAFETPSSGDKSHIVVENNTPKDTKKTNPESIIAITDEAVVAATISKDPSMIDYYSKTTGRAYQIDFNGNGKKSLPNKTAAGIVSATWSPDKTKVITKTVSGESTNFYYYDPNQQETPLKQNVDEVAWQNTSNRIFYKYYDTTTKQRTLSISNPDGTEWIKLADINVRDISITQIPQSSLVSFWNKADSFSETSLKSVSIVGGGERELFKGVFGADYLWNNNGTKALVSSVETSGGSKIQLSIINSIGGELKRLNVPTLVSKCVWLSDNKNIICALPGGIPDNAVIPNDYDQGKINTIDTFWKINTATGEKSRSLEIDKINGSYDATKLFLNTDESLLFFINRTDGKLYRANL
ncbi:MAG: hypothetical protein WAV31_06445 [Candidatus Moraniibacteriota bacterium]